MTLRNDLIASVAAARCKKPPRVLAAHELPTEDELLGVQCALDMLLSDEPIPYRLTLTGEYLADVYTTEILDLIK